MGLTALFLRHTTPPKTPSPMESCHLSNLQPCVSTDVCVCVYVSVHRRAANRMFWRKCVGAISGQRRVQAFRLHLCLCFSEAGGVKGPFSETNSILLQGRIVHNRFSILLTNIIQSLWKKKLGFTLEGFFSFFSFWYTITI